MKQIIIAGICFIAFACNTGRSTTSISEQNKSINNTVSTPLPVYKSSSLAGKAPAVPPVLPRKLRRPAIV